MNDRPPPPPIPRSGDERETSLAFLGFFRGALLDRAFGLNDLQIWHTHAPSSLSLGALLAHMAWVEQTWFRDRFVGLPMLEPWDAMDKANDRDAEMSLARDWSAANLRQQLQASIEDSDNHIGAAESLDAMSVRSDGHGEGWSLRWIVIHMIEEYARHCGHADLIREAIDGDTAS